MSEPQPPRTDIQGRILIASVAILGLLPGGHLLLHVISHAMGWACP